jgi:hypothetical protein
MDKNKYKTKATSILKSLPVRMRWPEWMPDLIPVADVVMDDGALALAMSAARNAAAYRIRSTSSGRPASRPSACRLR